MKLAILLLSLTFSYSLFASVLVCRHSKIQGVFAHLEENGIFYNTHSQHPGWKDYIWSQDAMCRSLAIPGTRAEIKIEQQGKFHFWYYGSINVISSGEPWSWINGYAGYTESSNTLYTGCGASDDQVWIDCRIEP
jgi:hypothetical protein